VRTRDGWDGIFYFVRSSFMKDPFRLCLFFSSVQQNWFHYFYLFRSFSYWTIVLWHWSFNKFTRFYFVRSSFMKDPFRLCLFFSSVQQNLFHYFYLFCSFSYWTIVQWHWSFNKFTRLVKKLMFFLSLFTNQSFKKKTIVFLSFGKFVRSVNFFLLFQVCILYRFFF